VNERYTIIQPAIAVQTAKDLLGQTCETQWWNSDQLAQHLPTFGNQILGAAIVIDDGRLLDIDS
jgi:hypothetical protein